MVSNMLDAVLNAPTLFIGQHVGVCIVVCSFSACYPNFDHVMSNCSGCCSFLKELVVIPFLQKWCHSIVSSSFYQKRPLPHLYPLIFPLRPRRILHCSLPCCILHTFLDCYCLFFAATVMIHYCHQKGQLVCLTFPAT